MKLILCVDNNLGYGLCGRRLTRDKVQRAHLLSFVRRKKARILMSAYSERSFIQDGSFSGEEAEARKKNPSGSDYFERAEGSDWVFAEDLDLEGRLDGVTELLLYRWNRLYPSDRRLPGNFETWLADGFELKESGVFKGSSHDSIGYEYYVRKQEKGSCGKRKA